MTTDTARTATECATTFRVRAPFRALLVAGVVTAVTLVSAAARADEREVCASAAERAQSLRDEGNYRGARAQMLVCARDVCPGPIKADCGRWLEDVQRDAPTIVFGATSSGKDVSDVKVTIDGVVIADRLDGTPHLVDAGEHTFVFERAGVKKEERALVRAGEKGRAIVIAFDAPASASRPTDRPAPAPPVPRDESSLVPAFIVGGIGVVALGSFAIFALQGMNDKDELETTCAPNCPQRDVDKLETKFIIADISLGVGVVALAVSAYMFVTRPKVSRTGTAARRLRGLRFDVAPAPGGGAAAVHATF